MESESQGHDVTDKAHDSEIQGSPNGHKQKAGANDEMNDLQNAAMGEKKVDDQGTDNGKLLRNFLAGGFKTMKEARSAKGKQNRKAFDVSNLPPQSYATVNFIDPTTQSDALLGSDASASQKFGFLGSKGSGGEANVALNLYEKLATIFQRDYQNTLLNVPYEHLRTGAAGNIEKLPIKTVLSQSHPTSSGGDAGVPWGGTPGSFASISDPAEWHTGSYCHVYIAACETVDQYRTKVRPALQAFISQIEGAASSSSSSSRNNPQNKITQSSSNYSAHYVIIYVPIREKSAEALQLEKDAKEGINRLGGAIASGVKNIRRAATAANRGEISSDSFHSTDSADLESDDLSSHPGPLAYSSKTEKEIFKKFTSDFPSGKICILSTLMDPIDNNSVTNATPVKNQEWNGFLHLLGAAVVSGFRDRCRRYDAELRRLDAARANSNKNVRKSGKTTNNKATFDLGHFFLVKESLAFTFEQMQLPAEALLQYEELRMFLPQTSGDDSPVRETEEEKKKRIKKAVRRQSDDFDDVATTLAITGDTIGFRKRLCSVTDIGIVEQTVLQYLYSRESSLLFQMKAPVELLHRSYTFVQNMYKMKASGLGIIETKTLNEEEEAARKVDAERWALNFCWDVKCAADKFFTVLQMSEEQRMLGRSDSDDGYDDEDDEHVTNISADPKVEAIEKRMVAKVGELLEFARLRYLRLGDFQDAFENPVRKVSNTVPSDLMIGWKPWIAEDDGPGIEKVEIVSPKQNFPVASENVSLLDGVFVSAFAYESRYLQLTAAVARCNRLAGRRRLASRHQTQMAEIYMNREDYNSATKALLPIVDVCATDGWDRCHFWHLFRLACCQRKSGKIPAYLNTLTLCFGSHLEGMAPKAAAEALQKDFEAVISHPQVSELRLGISSFLETDLTIEQTSGGKSSMLLNFVRKKLLKSICKVGENVRIKLTVRSYLPNAISAAKISILLVSFAKYEELFHNRELVSVDDAFANIKLDDSPTIEPGDNTYEFNWTPMSTGTFTLSTVQMKWNEGCFHYDSAVLRKPLLAIEVLPSDPTQTIELNPLFLIPGHVQDVRITFNAGSDIIEEGTVELVCSDGLQVVPPGTDSDSGQWVETCSIDLPPCDTNGISVLKTSVKSRLIAPPEQKLGHLMNDEPANVQSMKARVITSYRHKSYSASSDSNQNEMPCMKSTLEAVVTTLDKPAFTVDECRTYSCAEDKLLITIVLHCNTPVPFSIKEWNIELPGLEVADGGDMNQELFRYPISEGEQLSLAFTCAYMTGDKYKEGEPVLKLVLQDEFGKTFNQVLPLDLYFFYDQMRKDKEFAGASTIDAELTCGESDGLVGAPVSFSLKIDANNVLSRKDETNILLSYELISDDTDWIIGGQVKGILDCSSNKNHNIEFVGIPTCPGIVKLFPTLSIQYETSVEDSAPITVHFRHPDFFKSLSFVNHMALACPVELE